MMSHNIIPQNTLNCFRLAIMWYLIEKIQHSFQPKKSELIIQVVMMYFIGEPRKVVLYWKNLQNIDENRVQEMSPRIGR